MAPEPAAPRTTEVSESVEAAPTASARQDTALLTPREVLEQRYRERGMDFNAITAQAEEYQRARPSIVFPEDLSKLDIPFTKTPLDAATARSENMRGRAHVGRGVVEIAEGATGETLAEEARHMLGEGRGTPVLSRLFPGRGKKAAEYFTDSAELGAKLPEVMMAAGTRDPDEALRIAGFSEPGADVPEKMMELPGNAAALRDYYNQLRKADQKKLRGRMKEIMPGLVSNSRGTPREYVA
jgi:hypothetical protein